MKNLELDATKRTPKISLHTDGVMSMTGKSYPENTFEFYAPVIAWLEEYFESNAAEQTIFNLELTYFNSGSSKLFFNFFDLLDENSKKHNIVVHWIYDEDNESAKEAGEDFIEDFEDLNIILKVKE